MVIPQSVVVGLSLAGLASFVVPFVLYAVCRRRMRLPARNIALGAGTFAVFVVVLEAGVHAYLMKVNPATASWFAAHPWGFAIYAAGAAALFEESGRWIVLRFFARRTGDAGTAVAYGIGHGGIEAILVGLSQAVAASMAILANLGQLQLVLGAKTADVLKGLEHLDFPTAILGGVERIWAMLLQLALSLLVWRCIARGKVRWLVAAMALHAGTDFIAALAQKGIVSLYVVEGIVATMGMILLIVFTTRLPSQLISAAKQPLISAAKQP